LGACTIGNSTVSNNQATSLGGGIYFVNNGTKVMTNVTITGNTSVNSGGGIFANLGTLALTNVTISGNSTNINGGGIYVNGATTTLNHVTIVGNTADSDNNGSGNGGGFFRNGGVLNLKNSIVADNFDLGGQAPDCSGTITSQFYNHIESLTGCTFTPSTGDVTGSDPNLGALANNGGPTLTHLPNGGSAVLNSIPNGTNDCGTVITNDQRGAGRSFGGGCDKGAVELHEIISVGICAGADLAGVQTFPFTSGTVSLNVVTAAGLKCVTIEEMGSDHLAATGVVGDSGMYTGNWWHISGNVDSGFEVTVTLPHDGLTDPQVCKYPGTQGGYGWDCARTGADGSTV
jgi:predicted outer membrane repeat protein